MMIGLTACVRGGVGVWSRLHGNGLSGWKLASLVTPRSVACLKTFITGLQLGVLEGVLYNTSFCTGLTKLS